MRYFRALFFVCFVGAIFCRCKEDRPVEKKAEIINVQVPAFNADSAYAFIENQLDFGFRIPGTTSHMACKEWIVSKLDNYGAKVSQQDFTVSFQDVENVTATNIIAQFNPDKQRRILLSAHWDSRSIADKDDNAELHDEPILGADDGGSGVGVLLEIARTISLHPIDLGVDLVLFDAEDQGGSGDPCQNTCSWALGSQYWSNNIVPKNYSPEYGILLDMVGAKNASFYKEGVSMTYAQEHVDKIWTLAKRMGYSDYFIDRRTSGITDDHRYVNTIAKIPMLDIINLKPEQGSNLFHEDWHTTGDQIDIIDKRTLRVVGQVVTAVLYKESGNAL